MLLCSDGISGVLTVPELKEAMSLPPEEGCRLLETMVRKRPCRPRTTTQAC